jgi:hypothetical protein
MQEEKDPDKMVELAQQLIAKFDEERRRKGLPTTRKPESPSRSPGN